MNGPLFDRLSALSEPIRARLLRVLAREELAVGELARVLQTSQPTVSRHLKQLEEGGWVSKRRAGTASYLRLVPADLSPEARSLWQLVSAAMEAEAEPASQYAEDLRRLEGVLAARTGDSEELFRRLAGRWDLVRHELFGDAYLPPALVALLPPGLTIADLGCGTGAVLPVLAPAAARLIGVDREEAMLDVARERVAGLPRVELRRGLLDALPLDSASIDVALCQLVLHHVRDLPPVFAELRRVLVPGGRWVILDMAEHDREEYRDTMGHQHRGFSEQTLAGLAEGAGLRLTAYRPLPADPAAQGPSLALAVLERAPEPAERPPLKETPSSAPPG